MLRYIELEKTIKYRSLNGNRIKYNSLLIEYEPSGYIKVTLTNNGGCAPYNEIELTSRNVTPPEGYVAIRPNMPSSDTVIPQLEKQGIIIPHPERKVTTSGFVNYYLYSLSFTSIKPSPNYQKEKMLITL